MVGGGDNDPGMLDNQPHLNDEPSPMTRERERIRGNQDLWLLNLFFKACAFLR
jgi:hypothetical protein